MVSETDQEYEWLEAQKIEIGLDLVTAAKQQLQFLAAVDRNRWLYEGPALQRAIYRYNACWLPMLAKHSESKVFEGPLVVPLDCEWVWHCHRLNPVQYKSDCEKLYGRILGNSNVVSSVKGVCKRQSEDYWNKLYPEEPYKLNLEAALSEDISSEMEALEKIVKYDLLAAVKRQSPFYYQVSRAHVTNDIFLEEAVARYKGFLHIIKINKERSMRRFCVPTYDIDLIWHTHQLNPSCYCEDLSKAIGKVLEHDDMDADRSKGKKLDVGFSGTTAQWEEIYGRRYWKAGAMYRGSAPSPITTIPFSSDFLKKDLVAENEFHKIIQLPNRNSVEVFLEIVGVKNLPDEHKGNLFVTVRKSQPDVFFNAKEKLPISSESKRKQVVSIQCEPSGKFLFELLSCSPSNLQVTKASKMMGTASLSLQEFLDPVSTLSVEKWLELTPSTCNLASKPICLRVAVSFTTPAKVPSVLHMNWTRSLSKSTCFFPITGKANGPNSWTCLVDETRTEFISLQMRDSTKEKLSENCITRKQVIGRTNSGETHMLAELVGDRWYLMDSKWSLLSNLETGENGHLFELVGSRMVKLFQGRKLNYEAKHCEKQKSEKDFFTAILFSLEHPYGKAVALLDLKYGRVEVNEDWFLLPAVVLAFVLQDIVKRRGYNGFTAKGKYAVTGGTVTEKPNDFHEECMHINTTSVKAEVKLDAAGGNVVAPFKGGSCSGVCSGECGIMVNSGGCSGSCSGVCGSVLIGGGSGGCGGGCKVSGSVLIDGGSGGCGGGCKVSGSVPIDGGSGGCGGGCTECGGGGCSGGSGESMLINGGSGGCSGSCNGECGVESGSMLIDGGSGGCNGECGGGECGNILMDGGSGVCSGVCSGECGNMILGNSSFSNCIDDVIGAGTAAENSFIMTEVMAA